MGGVGSGGHNRLTIEEHKRRGTYRYQDRDRERAEAVASARRVEPVSVADRRRVLKGLSREARRLAASLMADFGYWDGAALVTLRSYCLSCERLSALESGGPSRELRAEARLNIALRKALALDQV